MRFCTLRGCRPLCSRVGSTTPRWRGSTRQLGSNCSCGPGGSASSPPENFPRRSRRSARKWLSMAASASPARSAARRCSASATRITRPTTAHVVRPVADYSRTGRSRACSSRIGPRTSTPLTGTREAPIHSMPESKFLPAVAVRGLSKTYASGLAALKHIDLTIDRGEIFALLGPNGAGKTTLINIICGIVTPTAGTVVANGHDIIRDFRAARSKIGLVPQELSTDAFESGWSTGSFSRGLFGKPRNPAHLEKILRALALWDRKDSKIMTLSGGMKRRVLIAKALSHEPTILFLDEPTAGVDVELRHEMWKMVRELREGGVTIILTTHYIEEAQEMADRIGVINKGELIALEDKDVLMRKLGKRQLSLQLLRPLDKIPSALASYALELSAGGHELTYTFDQSEQTSIAPLLKQLGERGIDFKDLHSRE